MDKAHRKLQLKRKLSKRLEKALKPFAGKLVNDGVKEEMVKVIHNILMKFAKEHPDDFGCCGDFDIL